MPLELDEERGGKKEACLQWLMTVEQLKGERERGGDVPPELGIDLSEIMNSSPSIDLWGRAEGLEKKTFGCVWTTNFSGAAIFLVLMNMARLL